MLISRVALTNWRNFVSVDVELSERAFLVGPNASGKSNLLDAFRFLRDISRSGGGLQKAILDRGGVSKIRCLAARRNPAVEIAADLRDGGTTWSYSLGFVQQVRGHRQPQITSERVTKNGKVILDRPNAADRQDAERLTQTHIEQINANGEFREIARLFESIRYLHLVPQLVRRPQDYQRSVSPDDSAGRNFLEALAKTTEKVRRSKLKRIEEALRHAVPQFRGLDMVRDETGTPHLEATYQHWRPRAGRQREDQFSDGTLRLIGLLWSLLDGDAPLLLEEPELSLNAEIVKRIPGMIHRLQRGNGRQVVISTHSWDLLSDRGIGGEEILMLHPEGEGTKVYLASARPELRNLLKAGMTPAEVVLPRTAPPQAQQLSLNLA